jgi:protein-tyrosine phosphatase
MSKVGILFVCHANICRSPMAERLARLALAEVIGLRADSAGTHARCGDPMHPRAAQVLRDLGADATGFASRPLDPQLLAGAGLVLAATREQRAACVRLVPAVIGRTFTIRQFGRLAGAIDPVAVTGTQPGQRLGATLAAMARVRATLQPSPDGDDLADPVGGTARDMRDCATRIQMWLRPALGLIAGP